MTGTGAKGGGVNFSQISVMLGQQELEGRRVPLSPSGYTLAPTLTLILALTLTLSLGLTLILTLTLSLALMLTLTLALTQALTLTLTRFDGSVMAQWSGTLAELDAAASGAGS